MPVATKEYTDSIFHHCYTLINNDKSEDPYYQQCFCMMFPEDSKCDSCGDSKHGKNPNCCERVFTHPKTDEELYETCCERYKTVKECKCSHIEKNKEMFPKSAFLRCGEQKEQKELKYLQQYR